MRTYLEQFIGNCHSPSTLTLCFQSRINNGGFTLRLPRKSTGCRTFDIWKSANYMLRSSRVRRQGLGRHRSIQTVPLWRWRPFSGLFLKYFPVLLIFETVADYWSFFPGSISESFNCHMGATQYSSSVSGNDTRYAGKWIICWHIQGTILILCLLSNYRVHMSSLPPFFFKNNCSDSRTEKLGERISLVTPLNSLRVLHLTCECGSADYFTVFLWVLKTLATFLFVHYTYCRYFLKVMMLS